ncbi:hypothetical protein NUU61_006633 [Penicillium alfredii]|uniref:PSI domain-containing protein n=1 Tax=Penicillium alfredii TaxID=1506179 RepID=A0A9W9F162_9EURO|nr:uncharacterized protein NUU61_006633 [Penicillium alfredii]KAJ5091763.1 hypothetical protein NUU61_006633 [Penicillium alfredii]
MSEDVGIERNHSFSPLNNLDDPLFYACWRRQSCSECLAGDVPCSWCAISSTCVPNQARLPILAPLQSTKICPLGPKERWELRALPFGCHASTMTVLAVGVAVLSTLALGALGFAIVWFVQRARQEKETESAEVDSQEEQPVCCGFLDCGILMTLFSLVSGQGQNQEEDDGAERSPLLG